MLAVSQQCICVVCRADTHIVAMLKNRLGNYVPGSNADPAVDTTETPDVVVLGLQESVDEDVGLVKSRCAASLPLVIGGFMLTDEMPPTGWFILPEKPVLADI